MLENIFVNVFGRSKSSKNSKNQAQTNQQQSTAAGMMGPFSGPSMPQPPALPYPPPAPYPASSFYPQLPFSQHTDDASALNDPTNNYQRGSMPNNHVAPLDSVPFETNLTLGSSSNLTSLDNLFKDIKQSADIVDQVDNYLKSNQSEYDFKVERGFLL